LAAVIYSFYFVVIFSGVISFGTVDENDDIPLTLFSFGKLSALGHTEFIFVFGVLFCTS